jgi:hypothetical protein
MTLPSVRDLLSIVENTQLDEAGAGPSRIVKHVQDGAPFFMISAMRADMPHSTNMRRTRLLSEQLAQYGLVFIRTTGEYQEDGQDAPSQEMSFFVMAPEHVKLDRFVKMGMSLMSIFKQDSILVGNGENVYLLFADGSTHSLGTAATFSPAVLAHLGGFSEIKGRKFSFTEPEAAPKAIRYGQQRAEKKLKPEVEKEPELTEDAPPGAPFQLDPVLDHANYQITDSLADVKTWKGKCFYSGSYTDESKNKNPGDWDTIGYVMISKTRNTIIPIPRTDEHHTGYSMLHDLNKRIQKNAPRARRGKNMPVEEVKYIDVADYIPIWTGGNNYIYDKSQVKDLLVVLKKYLGYGGPDGFMIGSNDMKGMVMSLSDFVRNNGPYVIRTGELAPIGKSIYAALKTVATALQAARNNPHQRSLLGKAFQASLSLLTLLYKTTSMNGLEWQEIKEVTKQVTALKKTGDVQQLEQIMFGFSSLKNKLHNRVRECLERKNNGDRSSWDDPDIMATWGDLGMAIDLLGRF